jgi:transcriptional regulator with XRE-family HTH domain
MYNPKLFQQWLHPLVEGRNKQAIADAAGISRQYLSALANGRPSDSGNFRRPSRKVAASIARALSAPQKEALYAAGYATEKEAKEASSVTSHLVAMFLELDSRGQQDVLQILTTLHRAHTSGVLEQLKQIGVTEAPAVPITDSSDN